MRKLILGLSAATLIASAAFANDQSEDTNVAAGESSAAQFTKLDADGDGRVSAIEAANDTQIAGSFTSADTDKDGYLSKAEFAELSRSMESESSSSPSGTMPPDSSTMPPSSTTPPSDTTQPPPQ